MTHENVMPRYDSVFCTGAVFTMLVSVESVPMSLVRRHHTIAERYQSDREHFARVMTTKDCA